MRSVLGAHYNAYAKGENITVISVLFLEIVAAALPFCLATLCYTEWSVFLHFLYEHQYAPITNSV